MRPEQAPGTGPPLKRVATPHRQSAPRTSPGTRLLLVALNSAGGPSGGGGGILAGVPPTHALMQQVVAAIELDVDDLESRAIGVGQAAAVARLGVEALFFARQRVDGLEDVGVGHDLPASLHAGVSQLYDLSRSADLGALTWERYPREADHRGR